MKSVWLIQCIVFYVPLVAENCADSLTERDNNLTITQSLNAQKKHPSRKVTVKRYTENHTGCSHCRLKG